MKCKIIHLFVKLTNLFQSKIVTTKVNKKFFVFVFYNRCDRGIFKFDGGNKRLRNVTKMYCQYQLSHKRRKKECLRKFKFSLNRLKKQILRTPIFVSASKGKVILI
jgi:hypothetical protein